MQYSREPGRDAWTVISWAMYRHDPQALELLPQARTELQRVVDDPHLAALRLPFYLNARLALGSWSVLTSVCHEAPVTDDMLAEQRNNMAIFLHDVTDGTFDIHRRDHVAKGGRDAITIALTARQPAEHQCFAYPSPPFTHRNDYYDRRNNISHHSLYIRTSLGTVPTLIRGTQTDESPSHAPKVLSLRLGELLVGAAVGETLEISKRAGTLTRGQRTLINLAARSISTERTEELSPARAGWLRLASRNLIQIAGRFVVYGNQ